VVLWQSILYGLLECLFPQRVIMDRIAITGGHELNGSIPISGAKNSAIKLMAASLLTSEPLVLKNMPRLADTRLLGRLLQRLGTGLELIDSEGLSQTTLHTPEITSSFAPYDLVRQMRASFNVLGPLLARTGHAKVSLPGGCTIGARPVDLHLKALEALGAHIDMNDGYVFAQAPRGLKGARISFPFVSVGATEHALMAAVLAEGQSVMENCAKEPEIVDLANCLVMMGAKIDGIGTGTMTIEGVTSLKGGEWSVVCDRIEAGTYAFCAAIAGGKVTLTGVRPDLIDSVIHKLRQTGCLVETGLNELTVIKPEGRLKPVDLTTDVYPGFATDLQAQFMAVMTMADGESVIKETIFENRFMHVPELCRLGSDISVSGGEARVRGVSDLRGAQVMATDLRASASLVIAALAAKGETIVHRVYHLDRGFERLEEKLTRVGAQIRRLKGENNVTETED
jgi:UDP-N-acetylglucosamine 1-carboxyvinyltransferase